MKRRGQASVEYIFILAILIGFVIAVMIPALREGELNIALSAARNSAEQFATANSSLYFTSLNYSIDGTKVKIKPSVYSYYNGNVFFPPEAKLLVLNAIRKAISPSSPELTPTATSFPAVNYEYFVE